MPLPRAASGISVCISTILPFSHLYSSDAISPSGSTASNLNILLLLVIFIILFSAANVAIYSSQLYRYSLKKWRCRELHRVVLIHHLSITLSYFALANSNFSIIVTSSPTTAPPASVTALQRRLKALRLILAVVLKPAFVLP